MKILQLKIRLEEIRPFIWRRFLVEDSISFHKLHQIIQEVMGWENYHLFEFKVDNKILSVNEDGYNPAESSLHMLTNSLEFQKMLEGKDLSKDGISLDIDKLNKILEKERKNKKENLDIKTPINKLIKSEKQKINYFYDFGDNWKHTIIVEKILEKEEGKKYPVCIKGERACPPEDCSGAYGYEEMLEIMKDKNHPEYEEKIVEWLGEDFDPEEFNLDVINKRL